MYRYICRYLNKVFWLKLVWIAYSNLTNEIDLTYVEKIVVNNEEILVNSQIAQAFNQHFVNVEKKLADKCYLLCIHLDNL